MQMFPQHAVSRKAIREIDGLRLEFGKRIAVKSSGKGFI